MKNNTYPKNMIIRIFLFGFLFLFNSVVAQDINIPPPATSNMEQKKLIEEFLKNSDYEASIKNYARFYLEMKMFDYSTVPPERNFEDKHLEQILNSITIEKFKSSIDNCFSFIPTEKLKAMVVFYREIGGNLSSNNSIFLISPTLRLNLENYLDYSIDQLNIKK